MVSNKKSSRFGLGILLGMVVGAIAGIFMAPKSGKENREAVLKKLQQLKKELQDAEIDKKVKEIYGDVTEKSLELYAKTRKELVKRLDDIKERVEEIDTDKYIEMVEDVVERVRKETDETVERARKLRDYLVDRWNDLTSKA
ncbi:YtxH domain-containing protein [Candidatus Roizmanbacteria bacterium]|nr:YtxH domain-containing protein [Candidatus Roizmanbacteria bacterium]